MDPVTLGTTILSLVPLAASITTTILAFYKDVKDAQKDRDDMLAELQALQGTLTSVSSLLTADAAKLTNVSFSNTSVLFSCTVTIGIKLKKLKKLLSKNISGSPEAASVGRVTGQDRVRGFVRETRNRLVWPLQKHDREDFLQTIRNFTLWLHLALSTEGCRLLSQTADEVLGILAVQSKQFQHLAKDVIEIKDRLHAVSNAIEAGKKRKERQDMLNKLSSSQQEIKHHDLHEERIEGTGAWLLRELVPWSDIASEHNVVVLHGDLGSGKTYLANAVIDELKTVDAVATSPFCFYYFAYSQIKEQTPINVLRSLLRQLFECSPGTSVEERLMRMSQSAIGNLKVTEWEVFIVEISRYLPKVYIVLDALDECNDDYDRGFFLRFVQRLTDSKTVRALLTCRSQVDHYPHIQIRAHQEDLSLYIREKLSLKLMHDEIDEDLANEMESKLIEYADGMFLLVHFQLERVLQEKTPGHTRDVLDKLMHGTVSQKLEHTFEEIIRRIQRLTPPSLLHWATDSLMWATYSKRPLRVEELSDALAVLPNLTAVSKSHRPKPSMILGCCMGLIKMDTGTTHVTLAHESIHEYLTRHEKRLFPDAAIRMASICLQYMSFKDFQTGPVEIKEDEEEGGRVDYNEEPGLLRDRITACPFVSYASAFWGAHVRASLDNHEIRKRTLDLLHSREAIAAAVQVAQYQRNMREEYYDKLECLSATPLHHACRYGLSSLLDELLQSHQLEIDCQTVLVKSTPIIIAAGSKRTEMVEKLLTHGAKPEIENWYGDALHCAAESGASGVLRVLVRHGMSLDEGGSQQRTALFRALDRDKVGTVKILFEIDATILTTTDRVDPRMFEAVSASGFSAILDAPIPFFHNAVLQNARNVVQWTARQRPELVNSSSVQCPTALHLAACAGNWKIAEILIRVSADLNAKDVMGRTPYDIALERGDHKMMRLLDHEKSQESELGVRTRSLNLTSAPDQI